MKEKQTISAFKMLMKFMIKILLYGLLVSVVGIYLQNYIINSLGEMKPIMELGIIYVLGIILDFLIIFLSTISIRRKYQVKENAKKIVLLVLTIVIFLMCLITTIQIHDVYKDLFEMNSNMFLLILYLIILVPRLIMLIYPAKVIKVEEIKEEPKQINTYKIESEKTNYQQVDTTSNQVIDESIKYDKVEEVWMDKVKKLEEKDILIVPEVKKEEVKSEVTLSPISIKQNEEEPVSLDNSTNKTAVSFEGFNVTNYSRGFEKTCSKCGMVISTDMQNCPRCGNQL